MWNAERRKQRGTATWELVDPSAHNKSTLGCFSYSPDDCLYRSDQQLLALKVDAAMGNCLFPPACDPNFVQLLSGRCFGVC